jgi:hypothetical protein
MWYVGTAYKMNARQQLECPLATTVAAPILTVSNVGAAPPD